MWPAAVAFVVVLLATVAASAWFGTRLGSAPGDAPPARSGESSAPGSSAAEPSTDAAAARRDGVGEVLDALGAAVVAKDKAAFLALVDPTQTRFRARQDRLFDRIAKVPLDAFGWEVVGDGPGLTAGREAVLPDGAWVAEVSMSFRYAGGDSSIERRQYFTFTPRDGGWQLAGDSDGAAVGVPNQPEIWDLGPINVVRGSSSLVVGSGSRTLLARYAREADQSVRDVARVWRRDWSGQPVVVVPRTQGQMAALTDSDGEGLSQIAAVTTGYTVSGGTRGDRVVINPGAWGELGPLGRRVVMAHEVTHLATRADTVRPVPIWLSEGFADYVAYEAVDLPVSVVAKDVLDQARDGKAPDALPDDGDFDASGGDIAPAYEGSWLACRMIADRYGEKRLIRLYVELADSSGGSPKAEIRQVLGVTEQRLVRQWRRYLENQAGR